MALPCIEIKPNRLSYSLYNWKRVGGAHPRIIAFAAGSTVPFDEIPHGWRAVGNAVSDLTGPRFKPQTSRSRDERVTARPTGWYNEILFSKRLTWSCTGIHVNRNWSKVRYQFTSKLCYFNCAFSFNKNEVSVSWIKNPQLMICRLVCCMINGGKQTLNNISKSCKKMCKTVTYRSIE